MRFFHGKDTFYVYLPAETSVCLFIEFREFHAFWTPETNSFEAARILKLKLHLIARGISVLWISLSCYSK